MFRSFTCCVLVISLLILGVESSIDTVGGEHPHGSDVEQLVNLDDTNSLDTHQENGHCTNCCHGHANAITFELNSSDCQSIGQSFPPPQLDFVSLVSIPPTPPPTA